MTKKLLYILTVCLLATGNAAAKTVVYSDNLVNEAGYSGAQTYDLDLQAKSIDEISAVIAASSATIAAASFNDGRAATGSITFASLTNLTTAQATNRLTVLSTSSLTGAHIVFNGVHITEGVEWNTKATKALTAADIGTALNTKFAGIILSTAPTGTAVVWSTAVTAGTDANSYAYESNNTSITVNASLFAGGKEAEWIQIGSKRYVVYTDFALGASVTTAATALAVDINAHTATTNIKASSLAGVVWTTATIVGTDGNYTITASSPTAMVPTKPTLLGGSAAAFSLAGSNISLPSHGMSTGLAVYFTTGTNVALDPLVHGTTYYLIKTDASNVALALTRAAAVAGTPIVFTSSRAATTTNTYTINLSTMAAHTGQPSWKWQVSNDGTNFADLTYKQNGVAVSSQTLQTYTFGGAVQAWDLGEVGYRYLRLNVVGPNSGAIWLKASVVGKKD